MKHFKLTSEIILFVIAFVSCRDSYTYETNRYDERSGFGETCKADEDCKNGLTCVDDICITTATTRMDSGLDPSRNGNASQQMDAGKDSSVPDQVADTRGGERESCTARRDCQEGLGCFNNTCLENRPDETDPLISLVRPQTRGTIGESCLVRNDCEEELACVGGKCVDDSIRIDVSAKDCIRIECEETEDCCDQFEPPSYRNCERYERDCEEQDGGYEADYCEPYQRYCVCRSVCEDSICVTYDVECLEDDDCDDDDEYCDEGICKPPCENDEQCPLFYACEDGECEEVGCSSDNECFLITHDPASVCTDHTCRIPCIRNADCTMDTAYGVMVDPYQVCDDGYCAYVGCRTDEECRILLGVANVDSEHERIVCE